jgi:hypothetical protein
MQDSRTPSTYKLTPGTSDIQRDIHEQKSQKKKSKSTAHLSCSHLSGKCYCYINLITFHTN